MRAKGPRAVHVPGLGTVAIERDLVDTPRSVQVVERQGCPAWLHVQRGETLPRPKDPYGTVTGLDSGIRHTLSASNGAHFDRPDPGSLLAEARKVVSRAKRHCTRGSRQDRRLRAQVRRLRQRANHIQDNAECHMAKDLSEANDVLENRALPNLTASARGTSSAPGSGTKRGLSEVLARARLAHLHRRIERRRVRDGMWCVKVHPGGTSDRRSGCGHKDSGSRHGAAFPGRG